MKHKPHSQKPRQVNPKDEGNLSAENNPNSEEMEKIYKELETWTEEQWEQTQKEWESLLDDYTKAIKSCIGPESTEVQQIVVRQLKYLKKLGIQTKKEDVFDRAKAYLDHPDWKKVFKSYHPQLLDFMLAAIEIYAESV